MQRSVSVSAAKGPWQVVATTAAMMMLVTGLAGCQKTTRLVAHNLCGFPVDVDANDADPPSSFNWTTLADDERKELNGVSESATEFFVWVRPAEGGVTGQFTVTREELNRGDASELEVVFEGDRCPPLGLPIEL